MPTCLEIAWFRMNKMHSMLARFVCKHVSCQVPSLRDGGQELRVNPLLVACSPQKCVPCMVMRRSDGQQCSRADNLTNRATNLHDITRILHGIPAMMILAVYGGDLVLACASILAEQDVKQLSLTNCNLPLVQSGFWHALHVSNTNPNERSMISNHAIE